MNGVFIHDLVAAGRFFDVLQFAKSYYAQLPALSLPYHPPLFPAIEAVFFAIFGVNPVAPKLAIALAVFISSILLFRLIMATHGSLTVATLSTITFLVLPEALWAGSEVMLEFPALVFVLLALCWLRKTDWEYSIRPALVFAALAGAAVWTKQQTIFLGAVPGLYLILTGRIRGLLKAPFWLSSFLFVVAVAGLTALSLPFQGAGVTQAIPTASQHAHERTYLSLIFRNVGFYFQAYPKMTGPAGIILIVSVAAGVCARLFKRSVVALYTAWAVLSLGTLLVIRPISTRYLFFVYPALIVLGYTGLVTALERLFGRKAAIVGAVAVAIVALAQFPYSTTYLHGPDDAARVIAAAKPRRVLYAGGADGNFIFHYRALQKTLQTTIIPGDKLPANAFTGEALSQFAHDYGVQYILMEEVPGLHMKRPWLSLLKDPPATMKLEERIPLTSSGRWNGTIHIFRFTAPSGSPKSDLSLRMFMLGGVMNFKLAE